MADPGFVDAGTTAHFSFEYDQTLNGAAASQLSGALIGNAEQDYKTITSWFDGLVPGGVPFNVKINPTSATRSGSTDGNEQITIDIGASNDFPLAREVLVAEMIEIFMQAQNKGWNRGKSNGEGLSQVAGFTIVPSEASGLDGVQRWLDDNDNAGHRRHDYVSDTDGTDGNPFSYGCSVLFIYYLASQLGFSMRAIVQAAADTLESVYHNLTQDSNVFNSTFAPLLAARFPLDQPSGLAGSTNPFPLPTSRSLSLVRYLAAHPLQERELIKDRVVSKNIGYLRAVLNSDRPPSLLVPSG